MSYIARDLARRLAAAGVESSALAALVCGMAAARAKAINCDGLLPQIAYLLKAFGPDEIESLAPGLRPRAEQP